MALIEVEYADSLAVIPAQQVDDLVVTTTPDSPTTRWVDRMFSRGLPISLSALISVLVAFGIGRFPRVGGDEGIYTEQAWSIIRGHLTPYTYTYDHPFFGWLQISPFAWVAQRFHIGGPLAVVDVRSVMVGYTFVTCLLVYGIARRLDFSRWTASLALLLMGLSPLFIVQSRQVLLDNIALPWILTAIFLALNPRRRQWVYGMAGVCFSIGVLSKETTLLLLPAVFYLVWTRTKAPLRTMSLMSFGVLGTLVMTIYPLFALLRHELFGGPGHVSIWDNEIKYQLIARAGSGSLWQHGTARYLLVNGWLRLDRWLLFGGLIAAVALLVNKKLRFLGIAAVLWAIPVVKPNGYLPTMYVISVLPMCALALAGVAETAFQLLKNRRTRLLPGRSMAIIATTAMVAAFCVPAGADWYVHWGRINSTGGVSAEAEALAWVKANVSRQDTVLTDDAFWVNLEQAGFNGPWHGGVSYYKFDLDPVSSAKYLPQGWKDISYAIVTPEMRVNTGAAAVYPRTTAVYHHATIVERFGAEPNTVEIEQVQPTRFNYGRGTQ